MSVTVVVKGGGVAAAKKVEMMSDSIVVYNVSTTLQCTCFVNVFVVVQGW